MRLHGPLLGCVHPLPCVYKQQFVVIETNSSVCYISLPTLTIFPLSYVETCYQVVWYQIMYVLLQWEIEYIIEWCYFCIHSPVFCGNYGVCVCVVRTTQLWMETTAMETMVGTTFWSAEQRNWCLHLVSLTSSIEPRLTGVCVWVCVYHCALYMQRTVENVQHNVCVVCPQVTSC